MLNLLSLSRSNGLKVDVSNGDGSEDLDGEASRSTLEGTKRGGAGKSDELGREDSKSGTHEKRDECVLRVQLAEERK